MKSIHNRVLNRYPQPIPHQAQSMLDAQAARLRRWTILMFLTTAVLFLFAVAALFHFKNQRPDTVAKASSLTPDTLFVAPKAIVKPRPLDSTPAKESKPAVPETPAGDKSRADKLPVEEPLAAQQRESLLEAIGGLSAAHLYQSYLNIGLVADAVESEAYTKADAAKILQTVGDVAALVEKQLEGVAKTRLDADDQQALERIRKVTGLLRAQSVALQSYWTTGAMEQATRYHETRANSWNELKEILGVEE